MAVCAHGGCERERAAGGLCWVHYNRKRRGRPMDAPVQQKRQRPADASLPGGPCGIPKCEKPSVSMGLCWAHYARDLRYGMTPADVAARLAEQGDGCAVCGGADPRHALGWCVDHDHVTGTVRGVLCHPCNIGLGIFGDSIDRMQRAIRYLRRGGHGQRALPSLDHQQPAQSP